MTTAAHIDFDDEDRTRRPKKAVVGSHREDEEVFGKAYDPKIIRRIWAFVRPYRKRLLIAVGAVLTFTLTNLAFPLIIRTAIDTGMSANGAETFGWCVAAFFVMTVINYGASYVQETTVGKVVENAGGEVVSFARFRVGA